MVTGDAPQLPFQFGALAIGGGVQPVAFRGVFLAEDPHRLGIHQVMLKRVQHPGLQVIALDDAGIGADRLALVGRGRTPEAIPGDHREAGAAAAAGHQPREQELRPPPGLPESLWFND